MKYLATLLLIFTAALSTGCTSAVVDNKDNYERGEKVVWKQNGDIFVVYYREHRGYGGRNSDQWIEYTVEKPPTEVEKEIEKNDPIERLHGERRRQMRVPARELEKLQLEEPLFERKALVKHKKTGLTGTIEARYQGFDEWVYKVFLDKDFENYEETGKSSFYDPRKIQEWDEKDILLLPVKRVEKPKPVEKRPYDDPPPKPDKKK